RHLAGGVKVRECTVSASGSRCGKLFVHGKTAPPGLVTHLRAGQEFVEPDRAELGPDAARRAEVGNATLGRDTGAGERPRRPPVLDQRAQPVDGGGCRSGPVAPIMLRSLSANSAD